MLKTMPGIYEQGTTFRYMCTPDHGSTLTMLSCDWRYVPGIQVMRTIVDMFTRSS